ncbi:MAG TPA: glycosyltransferase family 4 protein [Candidatus Paceibacterota bacterium]|nr:glycosyltransferase family 4 protein [Candidatus Paceibacterota bacterium]
MKLLYATSMTYPSALANRVQTLETARALAARLGSDFTLGVSAGNPNMPVKVMGSAPSPLLALRYLSLIRREGYTHVLLREERLLFFLALYAKTLGIPARFYLEAHSIYRDLLLAPALRSATGIIAITNGLREDLIKEFGIPSAKVAVVPDAVDAAAYERVESKEAARRRLGLPQDAPLVMYAGRLDGWKGLETLLAAELPEHTELVIIGGKPPEVETLQRRHPKVRFLGQRPYEELPQNLAAADVVVLPNTAREAISARHTSPLKLFAYLASGTPLVASDLPSIREVVDEASVTLVAPDDPAALAAGIASVLADPEAAAVRAARARELVQDYTWEKRAERLLAFIGR